MAADFSGTGMGARCSRFAGELEVVLVEVVAGTFGRAPPEQTDDETGDDWAHLETIFGLDCQTKRIKITI